MKKVLNSEFDIKLDFGRNTENPSRLFKSFAEMIDGLNKLDVVLAQSVNTAVESKIYLDDIEKGSIIGRFWNNLVISEDGQIDNANDKEKIEEFVEESRAESLKLISENKSSVEDLKNLQDKISQIAKDKELDETLNFVEPDPVKLAKSINTVNNACKDLTEEESFTLKSPNKEVKAIKAGTSDIDIEAVEEALAEDEYINESTQFYLIKKPDFLGDSAWNFKHGNKSITVKIADNDWLSKFHSGQIPVVPGDSLKVSVKQTSRYNTNGYLISEKLEIIEVIDVIHNQRNED